MVLDSGLSLPGWPISSAVKESIHGCSMIHRMASQAGAVRSQEIGFLNPAYSLARKRFIAWPSQRGPCLPVQPYVTDLMPTALCIPAQGWLDQRQRSRACLG